jgi:phytanoyl-CoA hydroxylase
VGVTTNQRRAGLEPCDGPRKDTVPGRFAAGAPSFLRDPVSALAGYEARGFHVETGVWDQARCAELRARAIELPGPRAGDFAPQMNPHRRDETFLRALADPTITAILERLVGGPVSAIQSQFFFCRPGTPGFTEHQDNHYVEARREVFASAWVALDDVAAENGALFVLPGSHREPLLPVEPVPNAEEQPGQAFNAIRQRSAVPPGYERIDVPVPCGAVVFIHGHLVHGSNDNHTVERSRPSLLMTYIRRGESFRPGASAGRAEVDVYALGARRGRARLSEEAAR